MNQNKERNKSCYDRTNAASNTEGNIRNRNPKTRNKRSE